jgi:hypothetical protein
METCKHIDEGRVCGGELNLVDKKVETTLTSDQGGVRLIAKGRSITTYTATEKVWLCRKCGREFKHLEG